MKIASKGEKMTKTNRQLSQKSLKRKANSMQSKIYLDTIELYKKSSICDTGSFILISIGG